MKFNFNEACQLSNLFSVSNVSNMPRGIGNISKIVFIIHISLLH